MSTTGTTTEADVFAERESAVRVYCRKFPAVFTRARGATVWDEEGRSWTDLMSGAGALNYGHNHPALVRAVVEYLQGDGITHSMDLHTAAKRAFLRAFTEVVLEPREMPHRVQFCGPTGSNAVEAALKLARGATGRTNVVAFTNGFHGMSLGALAATANRFKRSGGHAPLPDVTRLPYEGYLDGFDTLAYARKLLTDPGSGIEPPAAFVVEAVQGEGGVQAASVEWLRGLADLARELGSLLVLDDVQAGCGRTGSFLSCDGTGMRPDLVCLSKSLGGIGLPMAVVLVHPDLDRQSPGEHSGTFRGNNLAFVAATAALDLWRDGSFAEAVAARARFLDDRLRSLAARTGGTLRGRGMLRGITWADPAVAGRVSGRAFDLGVLAETSGPRGEVLKLLPPLVIEQRQLEDALATLEQAATEAKEAS
jgi:diaminobutyrate-2-oxoglutarate transaminase